MGPMGPMGPIWPHASISRMPAGLIDPGMTRTSRLRGRETPPRNEAPTEVSAGDARPSATASMAVDGGKVLTTLAGHML